MLIGYARVSKTEQHLELQLDALHKAGCEQIYEDKITGSKIERKGLEEALSHLRKGDTLVVWRLDRLGRSLKHLIETLTGLREKEIEFKSLTENIDTSTPTGVLMFHFIGALAEFERNLIRERTNAGLEAARALSLKEISSGNEPTQGWKLPAQEATLEADRKKGRRKQNAWLGNSTLINQTV